MASQLSSSSDKFGADSWTAAAEEYRQQSESGLTKVVTDTVLATANSILPFSGATAILDDGCGTGALTDSVIKLYEQDWPASVRLVATDFSQGMIDTVKSIQKERAATSPAWSRVETEVLNAEDLKILSDNSFSHVLSSLVLHFVPDYRKALQECYRVLAPGGVFCNASIAEAPWFDVLAEGLKVKAGPHHSIKLNADFATESAAEKLLASEGFKSIVYKDIDFKFPLPEDPAPIISNMIRSKNPGFKVMFGGWSEEDLDKATIMIVQAIRQRYGKGAINLKGRAVVSAARK